MTKQKELIIGRLADTFGCRCRGDIILNSRAGKIPTSEDENSDLKNRIEQESGPCVITRVPSPLRRLLGRRIVKATLNYTDDPDVPHEDLILELDSKEHIIISGYGQDGAGILEIRIDKKHQEAAAFASQKTGKS